MNVATRAEAHSQPASGRALWVGCPLASLPPDSPASCPLWHTFGLKTSPPSCPAGHLLHLLSLGSWDTGNAFAAVPCLCVEAIWELECFENGTFHSWPMRITSEFQILLPLPAHVCCFSPVDWVAENSCPRLSLSGGCLVELTDVSSREEVGQGGPAPSRPVLSCLPLTSGLHLRLPDHTAAQGRVPGLQCCAGAV